MDHYNENWSLVNNGSPKKSLIFQKYKQITLYRKRNVKYTINYMINCKLLIRLSWSDIGIQWHNYKDLTVNGRQILRHREKGICGAYS